MMLPRLLCLAGRRRGALVAPALRRLLTTTTASPTAVQPTHIVRSPHSDVAIPAATIHDYIWQGLSEYHNRDFVECAVTGRKLTYGQARDAAVRLAASLTSKTARGFGLAARAVVAIVLPNTPEYPVALLGAMEAGLIVSTINPVYTVGEISKQLVDSDAVLVFTDAPRFATVAAAVKEAAKIKGGRPAPIVCVRDSAEGHAPLPQGAIDFGELTAPSVDIAGFRTPEDVRSCDLAFLPYSSGTTGLPKGVMLSHHNIVSNLEQLHHPDVVLARKTEGDYQEVYPVVLPLFHIYGLVVLLFNKMCYGGKVITLPKFDPAVFVKTMANNKCTGLYVAPPLLLFLASADAVKPEMLAPVRFIMCGAAPSGAADVERLLPKVTSQLRVFQGYGMTETSPVVTMARRDLLKYASVGPPLANTEMYVRDVTTGESLPANKTGEVCVRGPQVMMGYLNNPKATSETIENTGFLRMGDIGYYDDIGDFYIVDRVKELIKVKGFQVAPAELEEVLREHPSVLDAAVVGVPDGRAGEVPRAYVVPKPNAPKADADNIAAFVAEKVAPYKKLTGGVQFIDAIPKNPSGKILRRQLKELR